MAGLATMNVYTFRIEKTLALKHIVLYPTVIQAGNKNYLVDCGYEETFEDFMAGLKALGIGIQDLHAIILSHDDIDHLGALHQFKSHHPELLVYASVIEEPSVSGKIKSERLEQAENSLEQVPPEYKNWALDFIEQLKNIRRLEVDRMVSDNELIEPGVVVIHTPGHTKGHISLFIPGEDILIANDAVVIEQGELDLANPAFTLDMVQAVKSVEKIRALNPRKIICYHGGIMTENIPDKLDALIKKYSKDQLH